ncbi:MAG: Fe2+-dependent dioxygenase [Limnothrix sp. RL_2_0]|nr:Fe2+-dependent dioxygenase [Limnothrix sp. RL_2_0]
MLFKIPQALSPKALQTTRKILDQAEFMDGKLTAGWHAKLVKQNQQLAQSFPKANQLRQTVSQSLNDHPLFQAAVRPKHIHHLLFSRYEIGMAYGRHVDNALMDQGLRADVSFTVFLNDPGEYDGGELVIEGADDERSYKLAAGDAIVYPSTTLHRVEAVTAGTRLVAVGWVQSFVRDAQCREILFDLEVSRRGLFAREGKTTEFDLLSKSIANLLRMWAE